MPAGYLLLKTDDADTTEVEGHLAQLDLRKIEVLGAEAEPLGRSMVRAIRQADLIVVVIGSRFTPTVAYELGLVSSKSKLVCGIIQQPGVEIPHGMRHFTWLRRYAEADANQAWFGLNEFVTSAISRRRASTKAHQTVACEAGSPRKRLHDLQIRRPSKTGLQPLGRAADELQERLGGNISVAELERLVATVFEKAGVERVVSRPHDKRGFDIAVWSPELQSVVGNPLVVEVKKLAHLGPGTRELAAVDAARRESNVAFALLLYSGPGRVDSERSANVLVARIDDFLGRLRKHDLGAVLREMAASPEG